VNNADERLRGEDIAHLGDILKRRLHYRTKQAKSRKEFYVFSVLITDNFMKLYCSSFSEENEYNFFLTSKITVPTLDSTYTSLQESM
jgi:hypothetical protein